MRDYRITTVLANGKKGPPVANHTNACPEIGDQVTLGGKDYRVVGRKFDLDALKLQTQHEGTVVPVQLTLE